MLHVHESSTQPPKEPYDHSRPRFFQAQHVAAGWLDRCPGPSPTRQKLLDALGGVSSSAQAAAQNAYQDTVKPLAQEVYGHAQEAAQVALERGGDLATQAVHKGTDVAGVLRETGGKQAHALLVAAQPVLSVAQSKLGDVLEDVQGRVQDTAAQVRKDGGKVVAQKVRQGRRQGLKMQKELSRELSVRGAKLEKVASKKLKAANKQAAKYERRLQRRQSRGGGNFLVTLALLLAGGVVLARVPAVRQAILKAVGTFSPEAAESLHRAGTNVRNIVGTVWMERIEPESATPAPAPKTSQATGSAAYASVEPGSPAQAAVPAKTDDKKADDTKADATKTDTKPADTKAEAAKPDTAKADTKPSDTKPADAPQKADAKPGDKAQPNAKN
ncbi:hypothetical protein MF271_13335 [Deinococcus sp. KNUC1210]|uniref:hypothetical protein n=1 Tax=Deinococcus sp. KNUC1210 TaxID=2917691 RepID=UPI001EF0142C|nr:hypothetical protein [Deinococcus sp. KNUC1210]ULH14946.1 hypothetical protein MF271_13335 [Deinococcus sp. KNUC1210]